MSNVDIDIETEFYLSLDKKCQRVMDDCYELIAKLDHYEDCKFNLPVQIKNVHIHLNAMLQYYGSCNFTQPLKEKAK